jgi:sec-independent protein translocase protein TatA
MSPSPMQLLIVALLVIVLFGASRLGEVGKGLGDGIRNFKKGISGDGDDADDAKKQLKGDSPKADVEAEVEEKAEKRA